MRNLCKVSGVRVSGVLYRAARRAPWLHQTPSPHSRAPPISGFKVLGFRVQGSGFRVQGSGFRMVDPPTWIHQTPSPPPRALPTPGFEILGFGVQGSGFRVQGSGFRVQGSGFRVVDPPTLIHQTPSPPPRALPRSGFGIKGGWVQGFAPLIDLGLVRSHEERGWLFQEPTQSRVSPSIL